jgi:hypothetical protein
MTTLDNNKLRSMLAGLKTNDPTDNSDTLVYIDYKKISKDLEDLNYFVEQAKKYRDEETVLRAAKACHALGIYLESKFETK